MRIVILGGGELGTMLCEQLQTGYNDVTFFDENVHVVERATEQRLTARAVDDVRDVGPLAELGLDFTTVVVVATERDSSNLLIAQLVKSRFDVERVVVRINDPQNRPAFGELEVEGVCTSQILARALATVVTNPA